MDKIIYEIESIQVLRKEIKEFIKAVIKSKYFEQNSKVKFNLKLEVDSSIEKTNENDFLSFAVENQYTCFEFLAMIPPKISAKINEKFFEKIKAMYSKRVKPIEIIIEINKIFI